MLNVSAWAGLAKADTPAASSAALANFFRSCFGNTLQSLLNPIDAPRY